jgi:hypothetical protein
VSTGVSSVELKRQLHEKSDPGIVQNIASMSLRAACRGRAARAFDSADAWGERVGKRAAEAIAHASMPISGVMVLLWQHLLSS